MAIDASTPVIIGVGQRTQDRGLLPGLEPLDAWKAACELAAEDAALCADALSEADFLGLCLPLSWTYDDPLARLADRLAADPRERVLAAASGTAGHVLLHRAAAAIRRGEARLAIICGGESLATARYHARRGEKPDWSFPAPPGTVVDLGTRRLAGEVSTGLAKGIGAVYGFAMRDIARRAHLGTAPDEYRRQLGEMQSGMTRVAAKNPRAWFPVFREPDFLTEPREDNRLVAYPYTKHMTAIMDVDIAAAIVLTSEGEADRLGISRDKRVYPWAACYAQDPQYTAVRPDLWKSEAMEAAAQAVLAAAGVTMAEIGHVDLYSCFPAAVNFAKDALGISDWPGERITVTGGLPYAGGPGSSYVLTSLTRMTEILRADNGSIGLVSALGKQMGHHAFGLYSTRPPLDVAAIDEAEVQAKVDRVPLVAVRDSYDGPATVVTYTIIYGGDGAASHGAAICDLPDGSRTYALIRDAELLAEAEVSELVGQQFHIASEDGLAGAGVMTKEAKRGRC
jgi:acetyl-CoA C-acetyltransferase